MNIDQILTETKTIAIVGLSHKLERASNEVARYLMPHYEIIPVNPRYDEVLGLKCYPDLESIPQAVDMVDVFQRSENVIPFVAPSIKIGAKVFWMQLDIWSPEARLQLEQAGIVVVEDKCPKIELARMRNNMTTGASQ